ncbi:hypothetical protein AAFN47_00825 [Hoeflea sp. CAU 1731]
MAINWSFTMAAIILVVYAIYIMHKKIPLTPSHAALFALAAALFILPNVVDFEWTGDGFKFTTREQGEGLAKQVEKLADQQVTINNNVTTLTETLKTVTDQIAALQRSGSNSTSENGNIIQWPQDGVFQGLIESGNRIDFQTQQLKGEIEMLKQQIAPPAVQ